MDLKEGSDYSQQKMRFGIRRVAGHRSWIRPMAKKDMIWCFLISERIATDLPHGGWSNEWFAKTLMLDQWIWRRDPIIYNKRWGSELGEWRFTDHAFIPSLRQTLSRAASCQRESPLICQTADDRMNDWSGFVILLSPRGIEEGGG